MMSFTSMVCVQVAVAVKPQASVAVADQVRSIT